MADETAELNNVKVKVFKGKCPIGGCGCEKKKVPLGTGYEDQGQEARRRVWNHLRYSTAHQFSGDTAEEASIAVDNLMLDEDSWLVISEQDWTIDEWEAFLRSEEEAAAADEVPMQGSTPMPSGNPRSQSRGTSAKSKPAAGRGPEDLTARLQEQIKRQTKNMLFFTKAASTCISALQVASNMSQEAARVFQQQKQAMEEGMEEMIDAFGLDRADLSRGSTRRMRLRDAASSVTLARDVRRSSRSRRSRSRSRGR